ncbi:MAG: hypothetical protein GXP54_13390 [Deltaproteobacteria bacterium]|nr:hypothetical protein [Deltaproteobacteria bacterium]
MLVSRADSTSAPEAAATAAALAAACFKDYIPTDYVMRFHSRPKGGILDGARIVKIIPRGRPSDLDSMGYNVIMAYPEAASSDKTSVFPSSTDTDVSSGEALVLAAARLASDLSIRVVAPYSRPAGFRYSLIKTLMAIASGSTTRDRPLHDAVIAFIRKYPKQSG